MKSEGLMKNIIHCLDNDSDDVKREIVYFLSNLAYRGNPDDVFSLYESSNITKYYDQFLSAKAKVSEEVLISLHNIVAFAKKYTMTANNSLIRELNNLGTLFLL
jgi:hypothetical protein